MESISPVRNQRKRQTHCFVPGCTTGYVSNRRNQISIFRVPKDPNLLQKWAKIIPRADKSLDDSCSVCELHFESSFIETHYKVMINGKEELLPRGRPSLAKDAVPSIFPNLPKYLSRPIPKKRMPKVRGSYEPPKKKIKPDCINLIDDIDVQLKEDLSSLEKTCQVTLPSKYWVQIKYEHSPDIICFAVSLSYSENNLFDKRIIVKEVSSEFHCSVYVKEILILEKSITNSKNLKAILDEVDGYHICKGIGKVVDFTQAEVKGKLTSDGFILRSKQCSGKINVAGVLCPFCKYQQKLLMNRHSYKKKTIHRKPYYYYSKFKMSLQAAKKIREKSALLLNEIKFLRKKQNKDICLSNSMAKLPHKQKLAISECLRASKRKSTRGMIYENNWLLECIIMRMKSPRLYEHLRLNKILVLPSYSCIKKSLNAYHSGYGFNPKTFEVLEKKIKNFDDFSRHGCILFDEMKLSENLQLQSDGIIQGYVDYGTYTPANKKVELCNHGLIIMFQPFVGDWTQILGTFATKGNIEGSMLTKLLIDALILAENSGLFVDCITGDGAPWNRVMWREVGIGVEDNGEIKCKVRHPVDDKRDLHFISDFPHLIKCMRNTFLKYGFVIPEGEVRPEFIKAAVREDEKLIRLKAMPKISKVHVAPNNFEKMRVTYAFQLFSMEVIKGMFIYDEQIKAYGDPEPTALFIKKVSHLIDIMTSRHIHKGLRCGSTDFDFLVKFLEYLNLWKSCSSSQGCLSQSTLIGLKVSISSTLSLVNYLTKEVKFSYLLTSRLSQDKLENLFSIIRQCKGCNDHPTSFEFLTIVECLAFYNLARPPKHHNLEQDVVNSLICTYETERESLSVFDSLIEDDVILPPVSLNTTTGHESIIQQNSDDRLIFYLSGYIARKLTKLIKCTDCQNEIQEPNPELVDNYISSFTRQFDMGGLKYPSKKLWDLVFNIESKFTNFYSFNNLHRDSILDLISLFTNSVKHIGCNIHHFSLTQQTVKYVLIIRMRFYLKALNKSKVTKREKQKCLKLRRCI